MSQTPLTIDAALSAQAPLPVEARHLLKSVFGYDDFRPGQDQVFSAGCHAHGQWQIHVLSIARFDGRGAHPCCLAAHCADARSSQPDAIAWYCSGNFEFDDPRG